MSFISHTRFTLILLILVTAPCVLYPEEEVIEFVYDDDTVLDQSLRALEEPAASQYPFTEEADDAYVDQPFNTTTVQQPQYIRSIEVQNNKLIPTEAIISRLPYHVGDQFDPLYTSTLIHNLYELEYFSDIRVRVRELSDDSVALIIIVQEDPIVNKIGLTGNKKVTREEIEKKIPLADLPTANPQKLSAIARQIKRFYREKDYHQAQVEPQIELLDDGRADVTFAITENKTSLVKRVFFEGNKAISSRKLRGLPIFTREDWILRFLDRAGSYQPDAIEVDRRVIENYYQSNGYLAARVTDVRVEPIGKSGYYTVTFVIEEGDFYTIGNVSIPGQDLINEDYLALRAGIYKGDAYSKDAIREALEVLRLIWGEFGYINAEVIPYIEPNPATNTVDVSLETELGNQIFLNRIKITGNKKTRDKVIRRMLTLVEGGLLTTHGMERSKSRVASLGYFDLREGVQWKIHPISDNMVDLELMLKEIKTGKIFGQMGFNGSLYDIASASTALKIGATVADTNVLGSGVSSYLALTVAADEKTINFNITDPWLFDRPINGSLDAYYRSSRYDEIKATLTTPEEQLGGASLTLGFITNRIQDMRCLFQAGLEVIHFKEMFRSALPLEQRQFERELDLIFNRRFESGQLAFVSNTVGQDFRNNPMHPTQGYQWSLISKFGIPIIDDKFSFYKFEADATWYTPLIGEFDLIFMLHGHLGFVEPLGNHLVPYRELFNIGGPSSVRGFVFGQVGPQLLGDPLGAKKAFFVNSELIFPVTKDFSIKAALFYDGGAGWDTPDAAQMSRGLLKNNKFNYRHAVGLSVRVTRPTPVRIDWGFKLDRKKGEKEFEVSLTALREF